MPVPELYRLCLCHALPCRSYEYWVLYRQHVRREEAEAFICNVPGDRTGVKPLTVEVPCGESEAQWLRAVQERLHSDAARYPHVTVEGCELCPRLRRPACRCTIDSI